MVGFIIASTLCIIVSIVNIIENASLSIFTLFFIIVYTKICDTHKSNFSVTEMVKYGFDVVGL